MKFRISAAARTPPSVDFLIFSLPDNSFVKTSFSSRSAAGCTRSRVAIRNTTSLRKRSVKCPRISQAWSRSRWTRIVAMICGCSLRISSDTDCESIHFKLSMPEASLPPRMRDSSTEALSSPSALVSTWRMYSSESRPTVELSAVWSRKSSSTSTTCSWAMPFMVAMAAPSLSTSRGPRNFITSAASLSPRASIRMAAFCSPVDSVIITYPCFDHVGHDPWIFLRQFPGHRQVFAVAACRIFFQFFQLCFAEQDLVFFAGLDQSRFDHGRRGAEIVDLAHHRAQHRPHDLDEKI